MANFPDVLQKTGPSSPDNIGFSALDGGRKSATFIVGNQNLNLFCKNMLGWVLPWGGTASGVNRSLPVADSQFPFLYVDSIENILQYQYVLSQDWENINLPPGKRLEAGMYPVTYPLYNESQVTVKYSPRNYQLLTNEYIALQEQTLVYFPRNPQAAPVRIENIMPEWLRFTFLSAESRTQSLGGDQGAYVYYAPGGNPVNAQPAGTGQISTLYTSNTIKLRWNNVPYSFVLGVDDTNLAYKTCLEYGIGCVNQYDFLGYPAGTLLFESYTVDRIYPQPFPLYVEQPITETYVPQNLLTCDIVFNFVYRAPIAGADYFIFPAGNRDGNRVYAGHNLVPRAQSGLYYANIFNLGWDDVLKEPRPNSYPVLNYFSFPFELLFTDPVWALSRLPIIP